jgi:HEPN domain-containing protein
MTPESHAWARKANKDFQTAMREMAIPAHGNPEAVCFHAHQCALRYLRARLALSDTPFPETSHIVVLLEMVLELEPEWDELRDALRVLRNTAMDMESLHVEPTREVAQQAFDACQAVRKRVRSRLESLSDTEAAV